MIEKTANNGKRLDVELPDYKGPAGLIDRGDGTAQLAHRHPTGARDRLRGAIVTVDDRAWRVAATQRSDFIKGFRVVDLEAASGSE